MGEMLKCTVKAGNSPQGIAERLRRAWECLRGPVPYKAVIYTPAASGITLLTVGAGGRIDVHKDGYLNLGPGCVIRDRDGGGFVIEMPPDESYATEPSASAVQMI